MLHSDGRAPYHWKHRIVTLLTSRLNRGVADISAGVPTHRQIGLSKWLHCARACHSLENLSQVVKNPHYTHLSIPDGWTRM